MKRSDSVPSHGCAVRIRYCESGIGSLISNSYSTPGLKHQYLMTQQKKVILKAQLGAVHWMI